MPEPNLDLRLEIAHVLFIDIVGYSKLLIDDQREFPRWDSLRANPRFVAILKRIGLE